MTITRTTGSLIALSLLTLTGCSGNTAEVSSGTSATTVETLTQIEESTDPTADADQPSPTTAPETTASTGATESTGAGSGAAADPANPTATDIPEATDLPPDPVGEEVTIAGAPATVCIYGDGWGTNVWAGNSNTSCEFVSAVHEALIDGLDPTSDNIRQHLKPAITVNSPVTQQSYDMTCVQRSDILMSCTGGANATVFFY